MLGRRRRTGGREADGLERLEMARAAPCAYARGYRADRSATRRLPGQESAAVRRRLRGHRPDPPHRRPMRGRRLLRRLPSPRPPSGSEPQPSPSIWAWTGSERVAGQRSGLSCRPVRPGVRTSPTLKPACPAISSNICSLSSATSQILTAAGLIFPGRGRTRRPRNRRSETSTRRAQAQNNQAEQPNLYAAVRYVGWRRPAPERRLRARLSPAFRVVGRLADPVTVPQARVAQLLTAVRRRVAQHVSSKLQVARGGAGTDRRGRA